MKKKNLNFLLIVFIFLFTNFIYADVLASTAGSYLNQNSNIVNNKELIEEKEFFLKMEELGFLIDKRKAIIFDTKEKLVKIINKEVADIINEDKLLEEKLKEKTAIKEQKIKEQKINILREQILEKVDLNLSKTVDITSKEIDNLKTDINKEINNVKLITNKEEIILKTEDNISKEIEFTLDTLSTLIDNQSFSFRQRDGRLLYKDSNKDGISDYDSIYVFNIDPNLFLPISIYNGKSINPEDKILLGFDPTKKELVKINKEEPIQSIVKELSTYKVKKIEFIEDKKIIFKGQALPNSFITLYIYSTPLIVTVKTDSNGEWSYLLDKELENGDHTIYVATVNNSGNIIAKSSPFLFTKTAEAISFKDASVAEVYIDHNKPSFLKGDMVIYIIILIIMVLLTLFGISISKKEKI